MARAHQLGPGAIGHVLLLKADARIPTLHGQADADLLVAVHQQRRHVGDLVAALLPGVHLAPQPPERFDLNVVHVVGMDALGHRPLQLLAQLDVHVALAGVPGQQVPEVADLLLTDPVDAPAAGSRLLRPRRWPAAPPLRADQRQGKCAWTAMGISTNTHNSNQAAITAGRCRHCPRAGCRSSAPEPDQ